MHANIRSLVNKTEDLTDLLNSFSFKFNLVGITESWLNEVSKNLINICGYDYVGRNRTGRHGGGVGFYVDCNCVYKVKDDLNNLGNVDFETFSIEVCNKNSRNKNKNMVIIVSYRPPSQDPKIYLNQLEKILHAVNNENKYICLMGDFNIDISNLNRDVNKTNLIHLMTCYNLAPLITTPTRSCINKRSVIDNIFVNFSQFVKLSGSLTCDLSDHLPILASFNIKMKRNISCSQPEMKFSYSKNLNCCLLNYDWNEVLDCNDVDAAFEKFTGSFQSCLFNSCLISSEKKKRMLSKQKPWITKDIKKLIKNKNKLFKVYLKNPSQFRYEKFREVCKLCNTMKNKSKRQYYNELVERHKTDIKKTWCIINEVINKRVNRLKNIKITMNDEIVENPENQLNQNFIDTAINLSKSFQHNNNWKSYLRNKISNSFFCLYASKNEIISTTQSLTPKSSSSWDNIPAKVVISTIHSTVMVLEYLINLSFAAGKFPKISKYYTAIFVFKQLSIKLPPTFDEYFKAVNNPRRVNYLMSNKSRTNLLHSHVVCRGPRIWNDILQNDFSFNGTSLTMFKKN
ncbi:hypothetical protein HELRODRAFT_172447 [Helobdella robusta]|uniref:Endonuclease/exonuclease/phosphatase domain-containing protein n=1 Tax=Helobdella robusta TaxID=6412 RepID=T1F5C4_HELRO|nr:hypothetical protein HELRODRAFT_172447 [Helobdella robusta]ESO04775.1 hypothetical protein HELRODRAFT_172447 [Helobdella robusta]